MYKPAINVPIKNALAQAVRLQEGAVHSTINNQYLSQKRLGFLCLISFCFPHLSFYSNVLLYLVSSLFEAEDYVSLQVLHLHRIPVLLPVNPVSPK